MRPAVEVQPSPTAIPGWAQRLRRMILSAAFLGYLLYVGLAVARFSAGLGEAAGYAVLAAFCVAYLLFAHRSTELGGAAYWAGCGVLAALFVAELSFARAAAFVMWRSPRWPSPRSSAPTSRSAGPTPSWLG